MNNDRLKFRVWCDGRWNVNLLFLDDRFKTVADDKPNLQLNSDEGAIIQQCTGLKDIHEKLIYEGDIISCIGQGDSFQEDLIGIVEFQDFEYVIVTNNDKWPVASFKVLSDKKILSNVFEISEEVCRNNTENVEALMAWKKANPGRSMSCSYSDLPNPYRI